MSEIQINGIDLIPIQAPELNQTGYAQNLSETFENINKNFVTLANYDFIKGESGNSVDIKEALFYDENGNFTKYGEMLVSYFETKYPDTYDRTIILPDGTELSLFDNFTPEKAGKLYLMVDVQNNTTEEYTAFSSLYYVFLDGRFSNEKIGYANQIHYDGLEDLSCILVYDKDINGFKSLENSFPTIYYENNIGLCWKVNGNNTGIPVQGIPGKNGKDARFYFVECESDSNDTEFEKKSAVTNIYQYPGSISIEDIEDIAEYDNCSAMIIIRRSNEKNSLYFGILGIENNKLYAHYNTGAEITDTLEITNFINILKSVNLTSENANPLRGLFIPMENENAENKQAAHLIAASSITNNVDDTTSGKNADIIFAGVDDINEFNPALSNKNFLVEKYLYLKVDISNDLFDIDDSSFSYNIINSLKTQLENNNKGSCILKYKLSKALYDYNDFPDDSKQFGNDNKNDSSKLNFDYYINFEGNNKTSNDSKDSFSDKFLNKIESGIYCWELCDVHHDFDADIYGHSNVIAYGTDISKYFKYVFTTTINPNIGTDFTWFNGLQLCNEYIIEADVWQSGSDVITKGATPSMTYTIYGWGKMSEQTLFSFVKFVPMINNDFKADEDTSLNIGYNINITGDQNDTVRNVTVSGAINCEEMKVSDIISGNEIENVYTKNEIVGDNGLKIGRRYKSSRYNLEVKDNGDTSLNGLFTVRDVKCANNINSKSIKTSSTASFKDIDVYSGTETLLSIKPYYSGYSNVIQIPVAPPVVEIPGGESQTRGAEQEYTDEQQPSTPGNPDSVLAPVHELNIDANSIRSININRSSKSSVITNNVTTINTDNAGMIVSNIDASSGQLCYYNVNAKDSFTNTTDNVLNFNSKNTDDIGSVNIESEIPLTYIYKNNDILDVDSLLKSDNLLINESYENSRFNTTEPASELNGTHEYDNSVIYSITMSKKNSGNYSSYEFDSNENIILNFGYYMFLVNLYAERSFGNWPVLQTSINGEYPSYLKFHVYYNIDGNEKKICESTYIEFESYRDDPGEEDGTLNTNIWTGVDVNGKILKKSYKKQNRYQGFVVKPSTITINDESVLSDIKEAYNSGNKIDIYAKADIRLSFKTKENMFDNPIGGLQVTRLVPINLVDNDNIYTINSDYTYSDVDKFGDKIYSAYNFLYDNDTSNNDNEYAAIRCKWGETANNYTHPLNWSINSNAPIVASNLTYKVCKTISKDNINSTTICEDGVVIRSHGYVFGIGYHESDNGSGPCLFMKGPNDTKIKYKEMTTLFN